MSVTKPITIDHDAPNSQTFTYEINGELVWLILNTQAIDGTCDV
jgi:hypothetical protein